MGAWIEISFTVHNPNGIRSHPTMGAWIEIVHMQSVQSIHRLSHPTMGAWIEIIYSDVSSQVASSRTPRWVRGLKSSVWYRSVYLRFVVAPHDGCVD